MKNVFKLPISDFVANHLVKKGITTTEEASKYLYPDIRNLHPARDLDGMKDAAELFIKHLEMKNNILVVADYDTDGVSSATIMTKGVGPIAKEYGSKFMMKFPNRVEGYGLNLEVLKKLIVTRKPNLVITVDNGIKSVNEIAYLKEQGIDVIVLDHHTPDMNNLPKPNVLVDLHLDGTTYPYKELCGASVAYKFVEMVYEHLGRTFDIQMELLQFAAIATIADVVSLTGENRLIVQLGVRSINSNPSLGVKALIDAFKIEGEIMTEHINYSLSPAINAPGRISVPDHAFILFVTKDFNEAKKHAENLVLYNDKRKELTRKYVDIGYEEIEKHPEDLVYVLQLDDCPEGIVGLVAGQIKERTNKPAIVLGRHDGYYTGSARSIPGFNIFEELKPFESLMIRYGGHSMAAGLSVSEENVDALRKGLNERAREILTDKDFEKNYDIEEDILTNKVIPNYFEDLKILEPFGQDNPRPIFKVDFETRAPKFKEDGTYVDILKELHLKVYGSEFVNAIGFNLAEEKDKIGNRVTLVGELSQNLYKGFKSFQINILKIG